MALYTLQVVYCSPSAQPTRAPICLAHSEHQRCKSMMLFHASCKFERLPYNNNNQTSKCLSFPRKKSLTLAYIGIEGAEMVIETHLLIVCINKQNLRPRILANACILHTGALMVLSDVL